jgi:hypothetical protein
LPLLGGPMCACPPDDDSSVATSTQPDDFDGRRPLTKQEREELLGLPLTGVFSSITSAGWFHSVPMHFLPRDGELRMVAGRDSVKDRNVRRTGRATLCVATTVEAERRYASAEGSIRIKDRVTQRDLDALDRRYARESADPATGAYDQSVTLVLRPERWIAWADYDD